MLIFYHLAESASGLIIPQQMFYYLNCNFYSSCRVFFIETILVSIKPNDLLL